MGVLLLATACGGGDSGGEGSDGPDSGEPVYGGEVVYGLEAETSGGWCLPEAQLAASGIEVARALYDTLTVPNADGEYVPFLAESVEPNEDFTTWTIKLRDGVEFHDGTELTAEVVKNNIDAYRGAYETRQPLLLRFIFEPVESVEVVDDMTLTVTTKLSWPAFPAALFSNGRAGIVAQTQLDDTETCDAKLVGTGPFVLDEWVVNERLRASRNPEYWGTDEYGNQLPYLDAIEFRPIVDQVTRANAVVGGDLDLAHSAAAASAETWAQAEAADQIQVVTSDQFPEVNYTMLNVGKAPFDNRNARLAAASAVDRDEYNTLRNLDMFTMASGPFGPGTPGYLEDAGFPGHDVEAAKRYAAAYEAETGEPLAFTYTHQSDAEAAQNAQVLQSMWEEAGIDVSLQSIEQAALISTSIAGDYQAMGFRNHPGGDPDTQYNWWFGGSPLNFSNIDDPEINSLLVEARSSTDPERRVEAYEEINRRFASEAFSLWLQWTRWSIATANDIQGVPGVPLPDGSEPFTGLAAGHPVAGIWRDGT